MQRKVHISECLFDLQYSQELHWEGRRVTQHLNFFMSLSLKNQTAGMLNMIKTRNEPLIAYKSNYIDPSNLLAYYQVPTESG